MIAPTKTLSAIAQVVIPYVALAALWILISDQVAEDRKSVV